MLFLLISRRLNRIWIAFRKWNCKNHTQILNSIRKNRLRKIWNLPNLSKIRWMISTAYTSTLRKKMRNSMICRIRSTPSNLALARIKLVSTKLKRKSRRSIIRIRRTAKLVTKIGISSLDLCSVPILDQRDKVCIII